MPYFKKALEQNLKPKLIYNKLIIKGKAYTVDIIHQSPDSIKIESPLHSQGDLVILALPCTLSPLPSWKILTMREPLIIVLSNSTSTIKPKQLAT